MSENRQTHWEQFKTWLEEMAFSHRWFSFADLVFDQGCSQTKQGALSLPASRHAVSLRFRYMVIEFDWFRGNFCKSP
jgi:hypothetical protein